MKEHLKYKLIEKLISVEDEQVLYLVDYLLNGNSNWGSLPTEVKENIEEAVREGELGHLEDHDHVMKVYREKYL